MTRARWGVLVLVSLVVATTCGTFLVPSSTDAACCYFAAKDKDINQPGQKAFIQWVPEEKTEAFTVQPKFEGNAVDFGMVIPTPAQPKLDEMPRDFFKDLAIYSILLPLPEAIELEDIGILNTGSIVGSAGPGRRGFGMRQKEKQQGVTVLEAGVVGSLDYKVITAEKADGLYEWLKENGYVYSGDEGTLKFYIEKKWFFTVMKIDPKQMKKKADGSYEGDVTPTKFTFSSEQCIYPLKITQISVKDKTDALLYVQSPAQMDLQGDLSWKHSFRVMYLTYMLGCSANEEQQKELTDRTQWMEKKKQADPRFETTKLEWARKLGEADMAVLDDPLKNYAQLAGGDLPSGAKLLTWDDFKASAMEALKKSGYEKPEDRWKEIEKEHPQGKGQVAKLENANNGYYYSPFLWLPNREAPDEDVKGLTRLKGHLKQGQWVTKIRKVLRKDEMTDDLTLVPVEAGSEQEYIRIMPTSPP